jgi:RHS repeat-associated protein
VVGRDVLAELRPRLIERIQTLNDVAPSGTSLYVYQYSSTERLSQVTKNGTLYQSYAYDGNGNRTSVTTPSTVDSLTYDKQDRLLSYGLLAHGYTRYSYTTSGELTQKVSPSGTSTYTYDELGNLIAAHPAGGSSITYLIDGANRRVAKVVNGTYTKGWLYRNGLNIVAEVNSAAQVTSRFVYGSRTNVPDYMVTVDSTYRIVSDDLGSVRLVVNTSTGYIRQRLEYDAWGNVLVDTNQGFQPFGFAGGLYDPDTKLLRFGARDYDGSVGRWTCKDPQTSTVSVGSLYTYCQGDPVNYIDPSGLFSLRSFLCGIARAVLTTVVSAAAAVAVVAALPVEAATAAILAAAVLGSLSLGFETGQVITGQNINASLSGGVTTTTMSDEQRSNRLGGLVVGWAGMGVISQGTGPGLSIEGMPNSGGYEARFGDDTNVGWHPWEQEPYGGTTLPHYHVTKPGGGPGSSSSWHRPWQKGW